MKQDKFMEEVKEIIKADILKKVLPRLIPERDIKQDKSILVLFVQSYYGGMHFYLYLIWKRWQIK